jgi:hypothetical protein
MPPQSTSPDFSEGGRLLATLAGGSRITFQTFDDTPAKRKGLTRILHGTLDQHAAALAELNVQGASINFMVNQGDGQGRRAMNVRTVRALFVDLDGAPVDPVLECQLQPHAIVRSSTGRYHAYWAVDGVGLSDFVPLQRAIAARFEGDKTVTDLPRVMRLPGSWHHKRERVTCELVALEDFPRYTRDEVIEAFGMVVSTGRSKPKLEVVDGAIPEGERNQRLFDLARGLVNKGYGHADVLSRIRAVNISKCIAPLPEVEVDALVASAVVHGPAGHLNLPVRVFDSPSYRGLSHAARTVAAMAYRRYNGENNGNISLPYSDFRVEFSRSETFYKARNEVVASGLLRVVRKHQYDGWAGHQPDLFEVALSPPGVLNKARSADT